MIVEEIKLLAFFDVKRWELYAYASIIILSVRFDFGSKSLIFINKHYGFEKAKVLLYNFSALIINNNTNTCLNANQAR